ncbi:MAG: GTP-binding protein [Candidatus Lokiarchaeota archaeon]|nr:GTP-binding protein [Candidatus Lokiarchaeota archaeon]
MEGESTLSKKKEKVYKIVLLGDESVGKTSTITQHVEKKFEESYKMTIGTDISAKLMEEGGKNIYLIIWDIGGQDKFKVLRESYLQGAFGALVLYDISNQFSYNHIPDWIADAEKYCGKIPLILCGNKNDLENKRVILAEDGKKLAKEIGAEFIETSAKTGENVDEAFNLLVQKIVK